MNQRAGTEAARTVDDRARGIVARVNAAHDMLRDDQLIKLEGLDSAVETLCRDIAGLSRAEQQGCKTVLIDLIDEFDRLSAAPADPGDDAAPAAPNGRGGFAAAVQGAITRRRRRESGGGDGAR